MKKSMLSILLALAAATQAATVESFAPPLLAPAQQQVQAANISAQILSRYHYKAAPLDDTMSEKIFDRYFKSLDPDRLFFIQADIDAFAGARTALDDAILQGDLKIPFGIFNLYEKRAVERLAYARELLKQDLDFTKNESYEYDREKAAWPKTEDEARDLWRKRVKNDWLRLKLTGKDDKAIRETLDKRYASSQGRVNKYKSDDAFQVFMNAYTTSVDPHTDYFGPRMSEDFDIAMRLSLVGIGAVLQERDEYITIRELVAGGPAAQSDKIKVGDRIVGVGQGKSGPITDVVGWRVDEVVTLIRGAKGSVVRLDILPADAGPDGKHATVELVRDKISLEKQAAKKSVIEVKDGAGTHKVGVITLPTFYQDFEARSKGENNFRSASQDVAKLLAELKKDKVEGVLIDLRNNGGGSLDEAIQMTNLFVGKGPVVQERNSQGSIKVESGKIPKRAWDGPLGVLINRGSASASEIFAAAVQDYGRGVVIGEPSFGKGTVQTLVNLDQMVHNDKPTFGELKMTVAQFFRVNGGTTQLRGVTPDIGYPPVSDMDSFGESSYDNALPWTQIKSADYKRAGEVGDLLPLLQQRHEARIAKDKDFQYLIEDLAELNAMRKKRVVSLNEAERRKEHDMQEARMKLRASADAKTDNKTGAKAAAKDGKTTVAKDAGAAQALAKDPAESQDEDSLDAELALENSKKDGKDVWLNEAANIVGDQVALLKERGGTRVAGAPGSQGNSAGVCCSRVDSAGR